MVTNCGGNVDSVESALAATTDADEAAEAELARDTDAAEMGAGIVGRKMGWAAETVMADAVEAAACCGLLLEPRLRLAVIFMACQLGWKKKQKISHESDSEYLLSIIYG